MSDPSRKLRKRKCKSKIKYESQHHALRAVEKMLVKTGHHMEVYYCYVDGGHWHIGHERRLAHQRLDDAMSNIE
jgi:hypothetical protein